VRSKQHQGSQGEPDHRVPRGPRPDVTTAALAVPLRRQAARAPDNQARRKHMAVAKVVTIIGHSTESFAKAADAAVQEAAKTIRNISGADVVSMSANVE